MCLVNREGYIENPCRASSLPYWKSRTISVPDHMKILHHDDFDPALWQDFADESYFRLLHDLRNLKAPSLPEDFSVCAASVEDFADHINSCYPDIGVSVVQLQEYTTRPTYRPVLWLAVKDDYSGKIVATGIAELDQEVEEGVLEWIQVSENYRGRGLGQFLVLQLLHRMVGTATFVTVSGKCHNPSNPEKLYRKCGFAGDDVWHILQKR